MSFKFGRSTPRSAGWSIPPSTGHLVVKMSSNMADLPLDLVADQSSQYWHLVVKMISNLADLSLDLLADLHPWYWNLVVKVSSNLADLPLDLLTDQYLPVLTSFGQEELKFSRSTPRSAGRSTPWYWHLMVKVSSNFGRSTPRSADRSAPSTEMLWSRWVQVWQIYPPGTDILWSRWVQIWQIYP